MKLPELVLEYERRRLEAQRHGSTAPLATIYGVVLDELRALDGIAFADRLVDTTEAAGILSVAPKTVARWAADGRFPGARKTSDEGEWRLPAREVYAEAGHGASLRTEATIPKLWTEGQNA